MNDPIGVLDTSAVLRLGELEPEDLPDEAVITATARAASAPVVAGSGPAGGSPVRATIVATGDRYPDS